MGLFGYVKIKDHDLLGVLAALKKAQKRRNNVHKDPDLIAEAVDPITGKRRDRYGKEMKRVQKQINNELIASLQIEIRKLKGEKVEDIS